MSEFSKNEYLKKSKVFCMMPWVHMHMWPNGDTFPCCLAESRMPVGNSHDNTIQELWNCKNMKNLRNNMLEGRQSQECRRCYEQEESGLETLRTSSNKEFAHHWWKVEETDNEGGAGMTNMAYLDIRFSNMCNLRCRTCGPTFSTSWYEDHVKLYGDPGIPKLLKAGKDMDAFFKELEPMLLDVEKVYWAGGEAIITEEHYRVLDFWIRHGMKEVRMNYTTNFSNMYFKKKPIFDYWNEFDHVIVAASLDGNHERGEYLRKNMKWDVIVQNRKDMMEHCPDVEFWLTPTVSIMNAHNVVEFHREWVNLGLLKPQNVRLNPLMDPEFYRTQCLPRKCKRMVEEKYREWMEELKQYPHTERIIHDYESLIDYMWKHDKTSELGVFFDKVDQLDKLRGESFLDTFTEYEKLKHYYHTNEFWKNRE